MSIENPGPESVTFSFDQTLYTSSKYHPTLYPFNASFYLLDSQMPFASIQTPQIQATNGTKSTVPPQQVNITHMDEFTKYVLLALASEEFTVALRGEGDLKQGSLPKTSVDYDKNITMKGLSFVSSWLREYEILPFTGFNRLSAFALQSFHVINGTEPDGTNAIGTASIPNPTVMTIDLGNVTLAMSVNGTPIGTATLPNLTLKPGDNLVDMRAEVYQLVVVGIVLESYHDGILPVDVAGNTSTYDGMQLPYYNAMLAATKLRLDLNVFDALKGSNLTERAVEML
ncbi:hypothetical protein H2198_005215 [Neophaeococcomyces mojaviensis]|uniref:Uncharacterized protein n=1 Tax=Neophaeococcomyces mojaviensis TaxID=3383035 RepID=A0ACC3A6M7_9EURO|nr:hypothetical protein H2198_005215 [Knufia sp. JES_112]